MSGTVGIQPGMKWIYNAPANGDIDADNDSVMDPQHGALIDLSDLASQVLGKQVSQLANYTIRKMHVALRNVDDADDNDDSTYFKGTLRWHYPTAHKMEALKLARAADKFDEGDEMDADGFWLRSTDTYRGMRFGWHNSGSSAWEADQVRHQTIEGFSSMSGTQWNLETIAHFYNQMHPATKTNSLFAGRFGLETQKVPWTVSAMNAEASAAQAVASDWNSGLMSSKCLGGLVFLNVSDSSGDEPGGVDDDYKVVVSIEFDVGVDA